MSSAFSFADNEDESMPLEGIKSAQVLADIENLMKSDEIGEGKAFPDGSLFVTYRTVAFRILPDGSFTGRRITG